MILKYIYCLCSISCLLFFSCTSPLRTKNEVVVRLNNDPEMLNPVNYNDARSGYILQNLFQKLIDVDYKDSNKIIPVLATGRPFINHTVDGKMLLTFTIRPEAKWDNGNDITAKDVAFTIKTLKCPLVNNPNSKSFFDFITDFKFYRENPEKFTVETDTLYFLAEAIFTDMFILPEYIYDSSHALKDISIKQIANEFEALKSNKQVKKFAESFNSSKFMFDVSAGSGAYKLSKWKKNEYIVLTRKENWWGNAFQKTNCYFEAFPSKIIYKTISDQTAAITALKAGNINVMDGIKSKDYSQIIQSKNITNNFNIFSAPAYTYLYISLNTLNPILKEKKVREALAHLTNVNNMIKIITYNQAVQSIGPVHPSKETCNTHLAPYNYNIELTKKLLEEDGWTDRDRNGILDKPINGSMQELDLRLMINSGNEERKSIALLFQAEAKKAGINITIQSLDWSVFLERCSNHNFDMMIGKWVSSAAPDDLKQTFHTSSATDGGANYSGYSNKKLDLILDSIRYEIDDKKRKVLYYKAQEIIHQDIPVIFLYIPTNKIAIDKKFENAYTSLVQPGYWVQGFKTKISDKQ